MRAECKIPDINDGAAFLAALEPHTNRLLYAATFMNMDVVWRGREAAEFADLLEAMASWVEGPAHRQMFGLFDEIIEKNGGGIDPGFRSELKSISRASYDGYLQAAIDNLRAASLPGKKVTFSGKGMLLLKSISDDLIMRTFVSIPKAMELMKEEARKFPDVESKAGECGQDR